MTKQKPGFDLLFTSQKYSGVANNFSRNPDRCNSLHKRLKSVDWFGVSVKNYKEWLLG